MTGCGRRLAVAAQVGHNQPILFRQYRNLLSPSKPSLWPSVNENHRRRIFGPSENVVQVDAVDEGAAMLEAGRASEVGEEKAHEVGENEREWREICKRSELKRQANRQGFVSGDEPRSLLQPPPPPPPQQQQQQQPLPRSRPKNPSDDETVSPTQRPPLGP